MVGKINSTFNICSSHAITQDVNLIETARAATFFMSDAVIITGTATGQPAEPNDVNGNFTLKIWQLFLIYKTMKLFKLNESEKKFKRF